MVGVIKKGFTLIELLVVVAIIGILAAVGVVAYNGYTKSAKNNATKSNIKLNDIASPRGEKIVVNGNQQYGSYVINQASLESNEDFKISSELNKNLSSNEFINSLLNKLSGYIENSSDIKISDITKKKSWKF